jgi:hypothetical protein
VSAGPSTRPARPARPIPTPPNDARIVAGYSEEMLRGAISDLTKVARPGAWEIARLEFLRAERHRRQTPST